MAPLPSAEAVAGPELHASVSLHRALYEISALTVSDIDLDAFFAQLHRILGTLLYSRNFSIMLYDPREDVVWYPYAVDEQDSAPPPSYRRPAADGLTGYVLRTRQPQRIDQARFQALVRAGELLNVIGYTDHNDWIGTPMVYQGVVLGLIVLQSYDASVSFSDDDLALLTFVGDHAAAALARKQSDDALRAAHASLSAGAAALQAKNAELEQTLSDLHAAQHELMRREKLASLGALVAGIAHEVNTPLGICVTAVSFLVDENRAVAERLQSGTLAVADFGAHIETESDLLRLVESNVLRASDLIRSFRQVAVDSASDDVREFALAGCIEETLRLLKPRFDGTGHTVEVACEPDLRVRSVPNAISQILSHLVVNALVHAFEHRDAGHIRIAARRDGPQLALDIRDDGAGMPREALAHLFDPFYTTKRGQGRIGLGANIVYNLVTARLGGTIAAQSVAGEGLAYLIRVPA